MRFASLLVTPDPCILPWPWELPLLRSLARRTLLATAPIGWVANPRKTSCCVALVPRPLTSGETSLILLCSNWTSPRFSMPYESKLRLADERARCFFHALAGSSWLSAGCGCILVFSACAAQHLAWRSGWGPWSFDSRPCGRLFAQAGSSYGHWPLCLHAQSALPR